MDNVYTEVLLDHNLHPDHKDIAIDGAEKVDVVNANCGDKFTIRYRVDGEVLTAISFSGVGCAISQASADMMAEFLIGKKISEAKQFFAEFRELIKTGEQNAELGDLNEFCGISKMPARVKCAELAWQFLEKLS